MLNRKPKKKSPWKKITQATSPTNTTLRFKDISNKELCKLSSKIYVSNKNQPLEKKRSDITKKIKSALITPKKTPLILNFNKVKSSACQKVSISAISTPTDTNKKARSSYKILHQIGSGGFGSVWKVEDRKSRKVCAMKEISKAKVIMKKSVGSVINEKEILDKLNNGFIINKHCAFQDRDYLYLIMEYLRGGDLRYHLCYYESFNEEQTRFIASCIILSLEYIHSEGIIHRDLKPENLVFEESGYLKLTDFGVARKHKTNNSDETSGTPGYMAPEVICRMNHSFEADFFALGVILFEIITGQRPYQGDSRKQIREKILAHQAKLHLKNTPLHWSHHSVDFVNKLLQRNKENRLGTKGIHELKEHPWLKGIEWAKMEHKKITPPFIPGVITETYEYEKQMQASHQTTLNEETLMLLKTTQIQQLFETYKNRKHSNIKSRKY